MESFDSESKRKLKAAIRAKLMQAGEFDDDQLPTFVMAMVANRRSKKEMDKELTLFLGDGTDSFTTWLLSIIKMLDVSRERSGSGIKRKSSSESDTEKKKIKKNQNMDLDESSILLDDKVNNTTKTQKTTSAPSVGSSPPLSQQQTTGLLAGVEHDKIAPADAVSNSSDDSMSTAASLKGKKIDKLIREKPKGDWDEEEDFFNIKEEDIEDFLNETEEAIETKQRKTVSIKPPNLDRQAIRTAQKSILEAVGSTLSSSALLDENKNSGGTGGNKRGEKKIVCSSAIVDLEKQQSSTSSALVSSKKSEGENLFKSIINRKRGLVSSREHQPSSLEKSTGRTNAQNRPAVGKSSSNNESDSDSFYESKHKEAKSSAITGVRGRKERSSSVEFVPSSESNASGRGIKRTVIYNRKTASATAVDTEGSDDQQYVEADSNSNQNVRKPEMPQKDSSPINPITKKCVQQDKKIPLNQSIGDSQSSSKNSYYPKEQQQLMVGTAQQIKVGSSKKDEKLETTTQKAALSAAVANVIRTPEPVETAEVEEYIPLESSPLFVVTLNGVDPGKFMHMDEEEEEDDSTFSAMFNDVDMNMEQSTDTQTAATRETLKLERCKFWPACLNGENCLYIHPSSACKMFPNCKFGKNCVFIHPKCKYNLSCTRFDCPYFHTYDARRAAVTFAATAKASAMFKPPCRYFPNCTNIACPFQHPKLCRFGKYCLKKNCQFTHIGPSNYTKYNMSGDKLKWTNPKLYSLVNVSSAATTTVNPQSQSTTATAAAAGNPQSQSTTAADLPSAGTSTDVLSS